MDKKELMEKVKAAKSAEEILEIAKEAGQEMTAEMANELYGEFHKSKELSEEELNAVAGGLRTNDGYLIVTSVYGCKDCTSFWGFCGSCDHKVWHNGASVCNINKR